MIRLPPTGHPNPTLVCGSREWRASFHVDSQGDTPSGLSRSSSRGDELGTLNAIDGIRNDNAFRGGALEIPEDQLCAALY